MNAHKLLASITPQRQLTHEQGKRVHLFWDDKHFRMARAEFGQFVRALERGMRYLYAEKGVYCVVHVDDDQREIWLGERCITLTRKDYRALLNAALTTETRLHGFRDPQASTTPFPAQLQISRYRPLRAMRLRWN